MNTTKIRTGLSNYDMTEWSNRRGDVTLTATNGNRAAYISAEGDAIRVSCFIEYGTDGRNWCDAGTYKTEAGAIRKAAGFLK